MWEFVYGVCFAVEDKMGSEAPQAGGFFKVHVPGVKGHSFSQAFTLWSSDFTNYPGCKIL